MLRLKTFGGLVIRRDSSPVEGAGAQRRRLALLALLAATGERGISRERLLGLLWPESDLERARKNLAQAVYALRRDLGEDELITGTADLRLNTDLITSDVAEFRQAISAGRLEDAVALYDGPFLDGVYIDEAPEFERWAELERGHLAHEYVAALEQLARRATEKGDHRTAVGYWRRLANADPLNGEVAAGLMRALAAQGDRGGALQHYRVYEMLLRQELELEPDARIKALADEIKKATDTRPAPPPAAPAPSPPPPPATPAPVATPAPAPVPPPSLASPPPLTEVPAETLRSTPAVARPLSPAAERKAPPAPPRLPGHTDEYARPRPLGERTSVELGSRPAALPAPRKPFLMRTSTRLGIALGFGLGLIVTVAALLMRGGASKGAAAPVVAVGMIQDYTRSDEGLTRPLADMLATDLARAPGMQVISTVRMYELMAQGGEGGDSMARVVKAARASGASELIDGALYGMRDGRYRLDLKRTNLATGGVVASYSSEAADLFALVSDARRQLAGAVDTTGGGSIADITTRSVVAYRFYEEGLRALMSNDQASARRLFNQALTEDSTFAMAAYWLAKVGGAFNDVSMIRGLERALRLAEKASDRERLTIRAGWANAVDDPSRVAIAETLTVRYPNEPEGYLWLARGRAWGGDFLGAIAPLRRVIVMDSLSLKVDPSRPGTTLRCYACEAYRELGSAYHLADSLPALVRTAREWMTRQPTNADAVIHLGFGYMFQDRFTEALAATQTLTAIDPNLPQEGFKAQLNLRAGNLTAFEEYYRQLTTGVLAGEGNKWMTILRRTQGRPREGLPYARFLRESEKVSRRDAAPYNALFEAQIWFDLGDFRRSAALFDSISRAPRDSTPSQIARHRVWTETLRATALAAGGDTALLPAIADSVERWGRGSAYGRDRRLHHHIRGLIAVARGQDEVAVTEFERGIFSPVMGYTRTNVELAKALLRLGRPREAAAWVSSAIRGPADGTNTYTTRTELVELAAMAWDAAGERDSALARYREVLNYWKEADPSYGARVERARLRVAALMAR